MLLIFFIIFFFPLSFLTFNYPYSFSDFFSDSASAICSKNDLKVAQTKTGRVVQGKAVWRVTVTNTCVCTQSQIMLSCRGFQSASSLDPLVLSVKGDQCLIMNGHDLSYKSIDVFFYAWDTPFPFAVTSSIVGSICVSY